MPKMFQWFEIADVPNEPGVYAWYYNPEITDYDLNQAITLIRRNCEAGDRKAAADEVRKFLNRAIFLPFQEEPYKATLRGPLKPQYEGLLEHRPSASETLIDRVLEEPERLQTIKSVLESSTPSFASPIYIGMSEQLRERLVRHKKLIERYRENLPSTFNYNSSIIQGEKRDQNFAQQISQRNIMPTRLFVMVKIIDSLSNRYVDIENILNRIHYPLLGRN